MYIIAIPDSSVIDCTDIRSKTEKIFQIARIAAIFKVQDIIIYHDPFLDPSRAQREKRLISRILKYIECPQYLRKRFFPLSRDTAAVGILSPLATPHHMKSKDLKADEIREAAIFLNQGRALADVGSTQLLELISPPNLSLKDRTLRFSVKIHKMGQKFKAEILSKPPTDRYWGFSVHSITTGISKYLLNRSEYKIATSRSCEPISSISIDKIKSKNILIAFGGPYKGIPQMVKAEGKKTSDIFDNCVSVLENYGTRALRLEEAMMIAFSKLEMILQ